MTDLIAIQKIAGCEKLKTMVLDSVSSPITKRVYNMALEEFLEWFQQGPRPGFTKATVSAWRVSLEERRLGSSSIIIRMSAIRKLAAARLPTNRTTRTRAGGGHLAREKREDSRHPHGQLAVPAAGAGAPERTRYLNAPRAARSGHSRRAPRLRPAAIRGVAAGSSPASSATRWPVVCR